MEKILITGCNGQLGRAMNVELKGTDCEIINTDVAELDITNIEKVMEMFNEVKPTIVVNCAAHTNVNACESQFDLAYRINAIGPRNLSIAATAVGAKMVQVSTDYVFDGEGKEPYKEYFPTCPQSAYGTTKLAGENYVKEFSNRYFIIRTAWLYGDGNNFVKTMLKLAQTNDTINVVSDQFGSPTSAKELAKAICYLMKTDNYGVFHGTCEGSCSWADFASKIFEMAGKDTKVNYITTDEYPTPAKRPAYSVLENYMLKQTTDFTFLQWEDALKEYMANM